MALLGFLCLAALIFVLATVGVAALCLIVTRRRLSHLPGPPLSSFWLGHIPAMREAADSGRTIKAFFADCYENYGPVCVYWILHFGIVHLCDAVEARRLLQDPELIVKHPIAYKAASYVYGKRFLGNGLVTQLDHRKWEDRHKLLSHAFRRQNLYDLLGPFNDIVDRFLDRISCLSSNGEKIAMREMFPLLAIDIIAKVAFGFESNAITEETPFRKAFRDAVDGLCECLTNPLSQYLPKHRAIRRRTHEGCDALRTFGRELILQRQKEILEGGEYGNDILGCILKSAANGRDLTVADLVDEFVTFFFAGHETTAVTMAFALQEILVNVDIRKRVVEEVDEVLVLRDNARISSFDLSSLTVLSCVLKETLRCHPPVIGVSRSPTSDITVCGHHIPTGTWIDIDINLIHNRADYWPNPLAFNPDRFLAISTESPLPYLPFSAGSRVCLGKLFAEIEIKLVLARLFSTFDIHLEDDKDTRGSEVVLLQRPKSHVYCTFRRRQRLSLGNKIDVQNGLH